MDRDFVVAYLDGRKQRLECTPEDAARLPVEDCSPMRTPTSYKGQRHLSGWYWFATTGKHVYHESRRELQALRMLDFDPTVATVAAQPFTLEWRDSDGKTTKRHTPDYFARRSVGSDRVVDVKAADRAVLTGFREVSVATRAACGEVGWDYEVVTGYAPALLANVEWLSAFRTPPAMFEEIAPTVLGMFQDSPETTIEEMVRVWSVPALVRPVIFYLMWQHVLVADLSKPLSSTSVVRLSRKGAEHAA